MNAYNPRMSRDDKRAVCGAFNNAGYVSFFFSYDYTGAYSYFLKARELAEKEGYEDILTDIWVNIGNIFANLEDGKRCIESYRQSYDCAVKSGQTAKALLAFNNLVSGGYTEYTDNEPLSGDIAKVRKLRFSDTVPLGRTTRLLVQAYDAEAAGRIEQTADYLRQARDAVDSDLTPERFRINLQLMLASLYQRNKNLPMMEKELRRAVQMSESDSLLYDTRKVAYLGMADMFDMLGRPDSVGLYRYKAMQVSDSILSAKKMGMIRDLDMSYSLDSMNQEIREITEKKRMQQTILLIVSVSAVLLLLAAGLLIRKERSLRKSQEAIFNRIQQDLARERIAKKEIRLTRTEAQEAAGTPEEKQEAAKYRKSALDSEEKDRIYARMLEVLQSDELYSPEFSLDRLASLTGSKAHHISQICSEVFRQNFNGIVNQYRIDEACRRLVDHEHYGALTIEAIGLSLGFKSRSHFSVIFKRMTGLTPGEYVKIGKEKAGKSA